MGKIELGKTVDDEDPVWEPEDNLGSEEEEEMWRADDKLSRLVQLANEKAKRGEAQKARQICELMALFQPAEDALDLRRGQDPLLPRSPEVSPCLLPRGAFGLALDFGSGGGEDVRLTGDLRLLSGRIVR